MTFAQFVMLTPFPGTLDFAAWEKSHRPDATQSIGGVPVTRHWLIPQALRPKVYMPHPTMAADEIRARTQAVWDKFYSLPQVWRRSRCVKSMKSRLAFVLISKLYRQMYANTGHRHRQRARRAIGTVGAHDRPARAGALRRRPDAGLAGAADLTGRGSGIAVEIRDQGSAPT